MKFLVAKKDGIKCGGCKSFILRGEDMVLNFIKTEDFKIVLTYHVPCYLPWFTDMFNRKWSEWKHGTGNIVRPRMGRPLAHINPTKQQLLHNLRSDRSYHRKVGHDIKVQILDGKIKTLTGG